MSKTTEKQPIEDFLKIISMSHEIGMIIAKNQENIDNTSKILEDNGFEQQQKVMGFFDVSKSYFIVNPLHPKEIYDFVTQYQTGQVEVFDKEEVSSKVFSPEYEDLSIILLITEDDLNKLETNNFSILSSVGPCLRI